MSKKSRSGTIFLGALLLIFIVYLTYQIINVFSDKVQTVDAALVTVEDKISADGVFIRPQLLIEGREGKSAEYLVANGEKVANGNKLAMFFDDLQSMEVYRDYKTLSDKIKSDAYAYEHMSDGADGLKLDGLILTNMLNVVGGLEQGAVSSVQNSYSDVKQIVARRDGARLTQAEFNAKQGEMRKELNALNSRMSGSSAGVFAPKSGYFVSGVDGYENIFTPTTMDKLTVDMITNSDKYREAQSETAIGSLIEGYNWYFAVAVPEAQAAGLSKNDIISIRFPQISSEPLDMKLHQVKKEGTQTILIFESSVMRQTYFNPRLEPSDIIKKTYKGIKVPADALRQVDGQWGVYCLVGAVVRFKPVEWVYQTDSYYLVKQAESSKKGLYNYDKIIISPGEFARNTVINK